VGIERWSQHRLRCVLGEPLVLDEVDDYIIAGSHSGSRIVHDFENARRVTLALIEELNSLPDIEKEKVVHNSLGPLSVKAWLVYIKMHSEWESKKLRK
jgi:hypothetical protein